MGGSVESWNTEQELSTSRELFPEIKWKWLQSFTDNFSLTDTYKYQLATMQNLSNWKVEDGKEWKNKLEELFLSFEKGDLSIKDLIDKIDFDKKNEVTDFYKKIENDSFFFSSVKENLSLDKKIFILQNICDKVSDFNGTDLDWKLFQKRHDLKEKIFFQKDEIDWLKQMAFNNQNEPNHWKDGIIRRIEKYFRVTDIITTWLGYNRNEIAKDNKIKTQVSEEAENNKLLYEWVTNGHINTKIGRAFLLRFLNEWKNLQRMNNKWIISEKTKNLLRKYAETWWRFVWLMQTLSYLDEDSQKKINNLDEAWLIVFLDALSNDKEIWDKIKNIMWYERSLETANRVVQLLVTETLIQNVIKKTETEVFESPKFLESEDYKEIKFRALNWKNNTKTAQSLYIRKLEQEGLNVVSGLSWQEKREKLDEIWNSLSDQEKNVYRQQARELDPEESRWLLKAEFRAKRKERAEQLAREKLSEKWVNYDELSSFEKGVNVLDVSYDETLSFSAKYLDEKTLVRKKEELDVVRNQNDQELYQAAQKYWFAEDLSKVRWEKYTKIESQYLASYDQKFGKVEEQYQNSSLWSHINNQVFANINTENQIFWNREIPRNVLNQWLTDEEYESYSNRIYPERTWDDSLYNDTNRIIKEEFKNRIIYFLWNCFDIKLDSKSQETLLKSFNFEEKDSSEEKASWEKKDNWEISLTWKDINGRKIKIYYNTETWSVNVGKWIDVNNNWGSIDTDKKDKNNLSFVTWPRIDDFYDKAKNISYSDILKNEKTNSFDDYKKEISNQLKILAPLENQWDFAKEELNKNFLVNIALQDIADVIWIRDLVEKESEIGSENKKLFSLLSRSFSTYDKKQIDDFRGVLKFMINYNEEVLSKKNLDKKSPQYIDNQLDDLEKSVSNDNYKNAKEITKVLFEKINKEKASWSFNWGVLLDFLNSFLSDKEWFSWNKNSIIDTKKILTYYEDLSQENQTDQEVNYMTTLNNNMAPYLAEYSLNEYISNNNIA